GARDGDALVFVERPAVEHHDVPAFAQEPLQLFRRDARRGARVLDELAERFARNVDAGEQFESGFGQSRSPAVERVYVEVAGAREDLRRALDQALAVVAE